MSDMFLSRDFLTEIEDECVAQLTTLVHDLASDLVGKDGMVYGEEQGVPMDTVLKMLDDQKTGVLDQLRVIAPKEYERRMTQYRQALRRVQPAGAASAAAAAPPLPAFPAVSAPLAAAKVANTDIMRMLRGGG